jgi:hypothetical protein
MIKDIQTINIFSRICYNHRVQSSFNSYGFLVKVKHGLDPFYLDSKSIK